MYNEKKIHQRVVERMKQKASGIIIKEKIVDKQNTKIEETRTKEKNPNVPKIKKTMEQMKKIKNEVEKLDEIDNYGYQHRAKKDGQKQFLALLSKEKLTRADKETHGEQKIYDATEQLEKGVI
ncbi:MAG TPA: hypothetical protein P5052_02035 [Candidatus Paceibacterota bacterium]|nr:hypothetical protein [Candidatus Paceibacterota bacterium]HRZ29533.1 hypothetical protein [Candidatus Paceibacterota bacterium]